METVNHVLNAIMGILILGILIGASAFARLLRSNAKLSVLLSDLNEHPENRSGKWREAKTDDTPKNAAGVPVLDLGDIYDDSIGRFDND
jgi:hypothetical protein